MKDWEQAAKPTIKHPPLGEHGWALTDSVVLVEWDTQQHMDSVSRVAALTKGCHCKSGCKVEVAKAERVMESVVLDALVTPARIQPATTMWH